jgi:hypothetical protein
MVVFGILYGLISLLVISAVVYLIIRRRNGNGGITAYEALITYFYTVTAASVVTMAVGLGYLAFVLFRHVYNDHRIANDVIIGITLLATGLLFCILHVIGRRAVERRQEKATKTLRRIFLFFLLTIFSVAGLVSLPLAVNSMLRYYVKASHTHNTPEQQLAFVLITVPFWVYYFFRVLKEMRSDKQRPETSSEKQS